MTSPSPEVTVFLGAYHFDGEPDVLRSGYDRLVAQFPPGAVVLNVCVVHEAGISVYDACPSRDVFDDFSSSPELLDAMSAAGLPAPRVTPLGDVHAARLGDTTLP